MSNQRSAAILTELPKTEVTHRATSKARRQYHIFKPKEIVQGEKFDLELTFSNKAEDFKGGFYKLLFKYPDGFYDDQKNFKVPPISKNEKTVTIFEDRIIEASGHCGLVFENQHCIVGDTEQSFNFLWDRKDNRLDPSTYSLISFPVVSNDELYQKYSVTVALWASVISIVFTMVGIFFSLFFPQKIHLILPNNPTIVGIVSRIKDLIFFKCILRT